MNDTSERSIYIYRFKKRLTFWDGIPSSRPGATPDPRVALVCQVLPPAGARWMTAGGPFGEEVVIPAIDLDNGFTPGGLLLAARRGMFGLSVWHEPAPDGPRPARKGP